MVWLSACVCPFLAHGRREPESRKLESESYHAWEYYIRAYALQLVALHWPGCECGQEIVQRPQQPDHVQQVGLDAVKGPERF